MSTASTHGITFAELLRYEREELDRWEAFFREHSEALDVPFAPGAGSRMGTVRDVVHHIAGVERRYADRLEGAPVTDFAGIARSPADALFDAARDANARLMRWVDSATPDDLTREIEFTTISAGTLRASARKVVAHTIVHGIRHWAQVATAVRQYGTPGEWQHDLLFSNLR